MSASVTFCSKCFKTILKNCTVVCEICQCKFHKFCAKIDDETAFNALTKYENLTYNCDNCLQSSRDLIQKISLLSYELNQIKSLLSQVLDNVSVNNQLSRSHRNLPTSQTGILSVLPLPSLSQTKSLNSSALLSSANKTKQNVINKPTRKVAVKDVNVHSSQISEALTDSAAADNSLCVVDTASVVNAGVNTDATNAITLLDNACVNPSLSSAASFEVAKLPVDSASVVNAGVNTDATNAITLLDDACVNLTADNANSELSVSAFREEVYSDWSRVTRRKKPSYKRREVVGVNNDSDLDVALKFKWVHLSSFKTSVSEENIISHVRKYLNIDVDRIVCYKLVKKDANLSDLKFLNFKLGVPSVYYDNLFNPNLWNSAIRIRPFKFFPRTVSPVHQK